jgi:hypothetical protein
MGEYSYHFYVRFRNSQEREATFTADCPGAEAKDRLLKCLESFPDVLSVRIDTLGHNPPETPE